MNSLILIGFFGVVAFVVSLTIRQIEPGVWYRFNIRSDVSALYAPILALLGAVTTLFSILYYYLSFGLVNPRSLLVARDVAFPAPEQPLPEALPAKPKVLSTPDLRISPIRSSRSLIIERSIVSRLREEIREQGRRSNINLIAGIITATLGVAILIWLSLESTKQLLSSSPLSAQIKSNQIVKLPESAYWAAFFSRSLVSVTCNIFAFFFLSTYRRNLSEVRYFQNELTNVQAKLLALSLTTDSNMKSVRAEILRKLSEVERNFVLRKGETTVDLGVKGLDQKELEGLSEILGRFAVAASDLKRPVQKQHDQ
jgi:hypothetical protein